MVLCLWSRLFHCYSQKNLTSFYMLQTWNSTKCISDKRIILTVTLIKNECHGKKHLYVTNVKLYKLHKSRQTRFQGHHPSVQGLTLGQICDPNASRKHPVMKTCWLWIETYKMIFFKMSWKFSHKPLETYMYGMPALWPAN